MKKFILLGLLTLATMVSYAADVGFQEPAQKEAVMPVIDLSAPVVVSMTMEQVYMVEPAVAEMPTVEFETADIAKPVTLIVGTRKAMKHIGKAPPKLPRHYSSLWCIRPKSSIRHVNI